MSAIPVSNLTQATLDGNGVFDVLMQANKAHLEAEFAKNRIKGAEYSTVYLGSLTQVMQTALAFVLAQTKTDLENQLLAKQIELVTQQKLNAEAEHAVLVAQECKLRAEYDLTMETKLKTAQETALLTQKVVTERAQVTSMGVDADSVVGKQKALYQAQTDGFKRDAEQKAAKTLIDTWNVRRTTDEGTVADSTNMLNDATVGRAVTKLLAGVGA
jgi:hypothetical protein